MDEIINKTPEQLKKEKIVKFNEDPDKFVCVDDIICMVLRTPQGLSTFRGAANRTEYEIALSRINHKIGQVFDVMDMQAAEAQASKLIKPGKSPIDFVRNGFKN